MKLRLTLKICKAMTDERSRYTGRQETLAVERSYRMKSSNGLMRAIGPAGRAEIISRSDPAGALDLLMRTPEDEWAGDPSVVLFKEKS